MNLRFISYMLCLLLAAPAIVSAQASNAPGAGAAAAPSTMPAEVYMFSSFRGNGEDGLHLAWSIDGLKWAPLNNDRSYLAPTLGDKLMRDPCIIQGPDGTFHLVWTTGWNDRIIGHSSSRDLINWTPQHSIPVMEHEPTAMNSWAPEIAYDEANEQYLIFWATTIPGRFKAGEESGDRSNRGMLNHRIYSTTTKDFITFSPTKLFFDPGFSVIDSTIAKDGNRFVMILKDETRTPPAKNLMVATSEKIEGPYTVLAKPFTPEGVWVEGPSLIKTGDEYVCYYDMYRDRRYGAMKTKDFLTWENITPQLQFNVGNVRHGTAFKVKSEVVTKLLNAAPTTQPRP